MILASFKSGTGIDLVRVLRQVSRPNRYAPPPLQITLAGGHRLYATVEYVNLRGTLVGLRLNPGGAHITVCAVDIDAVLLLDEFP